jgi:hypothetical protein
MDPGRTARLPYATIETQQDERLDSHQPVANANDRGALATMPGYPDKTTVPRPTE